MAGSVTSLISGLKKGQNEKAADLLKHEVIGFNWMRRVAEKKLRRSDGASDVALQAFAGVCHRLKEDKASFVKGREDLEKLLRAMLRNNAIKVLSKEHAKKRTAQVDRLSDCAEIPAPALPPDAELMAEELFEKVKKSLPVRNRDEYLAVLSCIRLGYTIEETAKKIGKSVATVTRHREEIRRLVRKFLEKDD